MSKYINADEQERIMKQNDKDCGDWVCVVRCKDCIYVWKHENGCYECGNGFCEVKADFYCADGERKDNDK